MRNQDMITQNIKFLCILITSSTAAKSIWISEATMILRIKGLNKTFKVVMIAI